MTMEMENFEFTIEHILSMHRGWITRMFIEDKKSEVEIVELLYERHLVVNLTQIHQCLLDWDLIPPSISRAQQNMSFTERNSVDDNNWEVLPPSRSLTTMDMFFSYAHEDTRPQALDLYTTRPLPSPPPPTRITSSSRSSTKHRSDPKRSSHRPSTTCHPNNHLQRPAAHSDFTSGGAFSSSSPLEILLDDQQRLAALGLLHRVPRDFYANSSHSEMLRERRLGVKTIVLRRSGTDRENKDQRKEEDREKKRKKKK